MELSLSAWDVMALGADTRGGLSLSESQRRFELEAVGEGGRTGSKGSQKLSSAWRAKGATELRVLDELVEDDWVTSEGARLRKAGAEVAFCERSCRQSISAPDGKSIEANRQKYNQVG
jgi:hypothetical protein